MKFIAGQTVKVRVGGELLVIKIEDASKGDTISARIEETDDAGSSYKPGQISEFNREDLTVDQ